MEVLAITILSVFAFIGIMSVKSHLLGLIGAKSNDMGIKLLLYLPPDSSLKLEGLIRQVFLEEIPEKLKTDGKLYALVSRNDPDTIKILERLKEQYPVEVLPDGVSYSMIQEKEK